MIYEHMSWCVGEHTDAAECRVTRSAGDWTVGVDATPCDHICLWTSDDTIWPPDLKRAAVAFGEMAALVAASDPEVNCESGQVHDHSDDDVYGSVGAGWN